MRATYRLWLGGVLLTAFVAAMTVAPSAALAQGAPTEDSKDMAREHYTKGKELYEAGDFAEALKEFQIAYDAKPHPTVLKSVAECQVQIGDLTGAIETFEKFLADPASTKKDEVEARLAEVKAMLGSIDVLTEPEGAGIVLDGESTGKTTPATLEVGPGDHEVVLNLDGFEPLAKQITVAKGEQAELSVNFDEEGIPAAASPDVDNLADPFAEGGEDEATESAGEGPPPAFWVCAAVAGVGLVSGTVFGTMALGDEEDYKNNPEDDTKKSGERNAIIADVSFGVAAAAAIVGAVILFTAGGDDEAEAGAEAKSKWNVSPVAGGDTIGVSTSVTF